MSVDVIKGDCIHTCHSEEQLNAFLANGWVVKEEKTAAKTKKAAK